MCGRFTLHSRDRIKLKGLSSLDLPFEARYNIAPSQRVLTIGDFGTGLEGRLMTWGLIPSWSTDGKGFINARAETLEEKPSFSESFRLRRCVIPADGFFEWKRAGRSKQPYYFEPREESAFAGIWDVWKSSQQAVVSCAIITTPANELVSELHNRMPAILLSDSYDVWLDRKANPAVLKKLLSPFPASNMTSHPVGRAVNYPANDSAELIERVKYEVGVTGSLF